MTIRKSDEISKADIEEYLDTYSDFSFEVSVLKQLTDLGFICQHSGTYEDPVSSRTREFDIRAILRPSSRRAAIRLAVECKNVRPNFPLVVHRLPRTAPEARIDVVSSRHDSVIAGYTPSIGRPVRLDRDQSLYPVGDYVGKSSDQVGRNNKSGVSGSDRDVFDKLSQALNSARDLLSAAHSSCLTVFPDDFSIVLPVLVVPAGRLWAVDYDADGARVAGPQLVRRVSYFVDREYEFSAKHAQAVARYSLSHLEIIEATHLKAFVCELLAAPEFEHMSLLKALAQQLAR